MNSQHIARFETQLENLVEGAFSHLFGRKLRARDIALALVRAMDESAQNDLESGDPRPIAPDHYTICVRREVQARLLDNNPNLASVLVQHLVELAANTGYRLRHVPHVELDGDDQLAIHRIVVKARHSGPRSSTTALMQRVEIHTEPPAPLNSQLIVQGSQIITLGHPIINVGRSRENQVVIDDASVSRFHLQLRLRSGRYVLFDTQSHGGTFVNEVRVREHVLQTGDVIRIGNTRLVYMEDHQSGDTQTGIYHPHDSNPTGFG